MDKLNLAKIAKSVRMTVSKHSPEILTGLGIAGMITTTVLAVKATPKALRLIEDAEEEKQEALTKSEVVKACWKCYAPATISGVFSTACLIGATSVNSRRNAALATAYKISETALTEYRDKVVETIGEKKETTVQDKLAEDRLKKDPIDKKEVIITGKGKTTCYDYWSGRYFEGDIDQIKRAAIKLNQQMTLNAFGYASLNDFYDEIGLDHIGVGYDLGWNVTNLINLHLSAQLLEDDRPCVVISHTNAPKYGYENAM